MVGIYIITNTINGNRYIGQSIDIKRRFWDHRCISHERNRHMKHALKKYGKENFRYEVLEECDVDALDERETYYINLLKPEYNVMSGGQVHREVTDDVKKILSEKSKQQWRKKSASERADIIKNNLIGPRKGHPVLPETREKLRNANIGKKQSEETISKRMETFRRKKEAGWVKNGKAHCKRIVCMETGEVFESVKSAGEHFNMRSTNISAMLKGRQATAKGYHFKYFDSVETLPDECREVGRKDELPSEVRGTHKV